jgi:hypothetical protein
MDTNFSVHYQTWKNKEAVNYTLTEFRKYFPTNPIRLVSDNGGDYTDFVDKFKLNYTFESSNVFPGGRFGEISHCYEWLSRVNDTCTLYDTEWVVIFEDDVLTTKNNITYPTADSGGVNVNRWKPQLTEELKKHNITNQNWGYGMCGGSIFKREVFLDCYSKLNEFPLEELSKLDNRILGWSDTLINCLIQYFGYTYEVWDGMGDMTIEKQIPETACFVHGFKEFY